MARVIRIALPFGIVRDLLRELNTDDGVRNRWADRLVAVSHIPTERVRAERAVAVFAALSAALASVYPGRVKPVKDAGNARE